MAAMRKLRRSVEAVDEWPVWAVPAGRPSHSDLHRLRYRQGVLDLDAEVANGAVHLRMAEQKLNRP